METFEFKQNLMIYQNLNFSKIWPDFENIKRYALRYRNVNFCDFCLILIFPVREYQFYSSNASDYFSFWEQIFHRAICNILIEKP